MGARRYIVRRGGGGGKPKKGPQKFVGSFLVPPPQSFRKEMNNNYVHFRRVFVEFVVHLTKMCPINIDF